ncbi:cytochrome b5 [Pyrrhoderma noxium]|uniref:Cytochrome b5 n=1 Tax=Pyrrhoderma noxium TaxID=2282107 RepID=A0A286UFZ1_9AGAM|nr:cytochrome b5 [Pyrrhoderma noxium]
MCGTPRSGDPMASLPFPLSGSQVLLLSALSLPILIVLGRIFRSTASSTSIRSSSPSNDDLTEEEKEERETTSVMSPENTDLAPPQDDPFTLEQLRAFDGSDPEKPIYVSIKGTVFDVTKKRDMYGPGKSYNIFAGKDGSRGLGMSSLKTEDAVPDYSVLPDNEMKVLNDWHAFFSKRYNIVGRVSDLPEIVSSR